MLKYIFITYNTIFWSCNILLFFTNDYKINPPIKATKNTNNHKIKYFYCFNKLLMAIKQRPVNPAFQ